MIDMAVAELFNFLKKHPDKWFNKKELMDATKLDYNQINRAIYMGSFYINIKKGDCGKKHIGFCLYSFKPITPYKPIRTILKL